MRNLRIAVPLLLALVAGATILGGCGKPADDQIMAAEDSIKAAIAAGADDLSPKLLEKAQGLVQEAKMLNEQGHYSQARQKAEFAVLRAQEATKNASRMGSVQKQKAEGSPPKEPVAEPPGSGK